MNVHMINHDESDSQPQSWRERCYEIIFEADTPAGKLFDVVLLVAIFLSVLVVMLESVESIRVAHRRVLVGAEWFFTILFTIEYVMRLVCAPRPLRYARSFFGVVDLLAILPTYFIVLLPGAHRLTVVRALRLLRAFRIFKLAHMLHEATALRRAVWASRSKIAVFLTFVVIVVVIFGSAMHLIEGPESGFTSIPQSMYWAIVTMTTVGYGDIAPETPLGKALAAVIMMLGYCMIIVPTGIVSAELAGATIRKPLTTQVCPECMAEGHDTDAKHCKFCGGRL
jgi:voltage-gated potassium channel